MVVYGKTLRFSVFMITPIYVSFFSFLFLVNIHTYDDT